MLALPDTHIRPLTRILTVRGNVKQTNKQNKPRTNKQQAERPNSLQANSAAFPQWNIKLGQNKLCDIVTTVVFIP